MVNALQQFIVTIGDGASEFRDCYDGVMSVGSRKLGRTGKKQDRDEAVTSWMPT
jgi:hypothetical protein